MNPTKMRQGLEEPLRQLREVVRRVAKVCNECKVSGAPSFGGNPDKERGEKRGQRREFCRVTAFLKSCLATFAVSALVSGYGDYALRVWFELWQ